MNTVVITGCHGFVAGSFAKTCLRRGWEVVGVARAAQAPRDWVGGFHSLDLVHDDLLPVLAATKPALIFHGAGTASVARSFEAPQADLRAAVVTFAGVLDAVRRAGLDTRVVFPSSAAVCGQPNTPIVTETTPVAPISPYGFHKAACELLAEEYRTCFGVKTIVARIFSTYGPTQRRLLLWELFLQGVRDGKLVLQGSGNEERDYCHIEDVCGAMLEVATHANAPHLVNMASGRSVTVRVLAETVAGLLKLDAPVTCLGQARPGDPERWAASNDLLGRYCRGSFRSLEQGVEECVAAWLGDEPRPHAARGD